MPHAFWNAVIACAISPKRIGCHQLSFANHLAYSRSRKDKSSAFYRVDIEPDKIEAWQHARSQFECLISAVEKDACCQKAFAPDDLDLREKYGADCPLLAPAMLYCCYMKTYRGSELPIRE